MTTHLPPPPQSSPHIELPPGYDRRLPTNQDHPLTDNLQSAVKAHPWMSQIVIALAVGFAGLFSGKFVWDDNSKAIREVQYELKEMRKDLERQAEGWELAKENQTKLGELKLMQLAIDSLKDRVYNLENQEWRDNLNDWDHKRKGKRQ